MPLGVRLDLPQDLVGDRGGVPFAEGKIAEQVRDEVVPRPTEVAVRRLTCGVAQVEQQSGDCIRHGELLTHSTRWPPTSTSLTIEHIRELRRVVHVYSRKRIDSWWRDYSPDFLTSSGGWCAARGGRRTTWG